MHNPLSILCEQLGLRHGSIADVLGCSAGMVESMLSEEPKEPLRNYLRLAQMLGIKMRLVADQRFCVWFDVSAIDELHYSAEFRSSMRLAPLPANRGELRHLIKKLRRRGASYSEIADHMQSNFIPTATGVYHWRRSTIGQHLKLRVSGSDDDLALGTTEEFRRAFRSFVLGHLLVAICPFDPFASVRYGMEQTEREGRIYLDATEPIPQAIGRWIVAAIIKLGWFRDNQWGEVKNAVRNRESLCAAQGQAAAAAGLPPGGAAEAGQAA